MATMDVDASTAIVNEKENPLYKASLRNSFTTPGQYNPIYILTGVFGGLFIILPLLVRRSPNRVIIRCSMMLSIFCIWIFWVTVYIGQMNPIMGPRMHNTTVAWIAHAKGDPLRASGFREGEEEIGDYQ